MLATAHPSALPVSAGELCRAMLGEAGAMPDASRLDRVLRHDPERALLEVQAGAPWSALPVGATFPGRSVGEAVAANLAGPDGRPVVAHLRALTLVTPDGELRRASRERSPELFALAVGGMGVFGPFYSLTFDLASLAEAAGAPLDTVRLEPEPEAHCGTSIELLLPPGGRDAFVASARAAIEERRCAPTLLEARRVLPEADTCLRWARREYVALRIGFRVRATLGASVGATQLRARLLELSLAAGGAFMPADLPLASRAQAEACYPMLGTFLAEKRRLDPAERVSPRWYRDASRLWRGDACRVRWSAT
jgi:hypothetical protein